MTYDIRMNLPAEWQKEARNYVDEESGIEVTHVVPGLHQQEEAYMPST